MRGRKKKPTHLKRLHGNPGKRALPKREPAPRGSLALPPDWLTENQQAGWAYAIAHAPRGLLKQIDRSALIVWVVAEDLHRRAARELEQSGALLVKTPNTGFPVQSPYLPIVNKQAQIIMKAVEQLGFSPAARPRLTQGYSPPPYDETPDNAAIEGTDGDDDLDAFLAAKPSRLN